MDFRDRLLKNELRCLSDNVRAMSDELILIRDFVEYKFGSEFKKFLSSNSNPGTTKSNSRPYDSSSGTGTVVEEKRIKLRNKSPNISSASEEALEDTKKLFSKSNRRLRSKRKTKRVEGSEDSESENNDSRNDLPLTMEMFEVPAIFKPNSALGEGGDNLDEAEKDQDSLSNVQIKSLKSLRSYDEDHDFQDSCSDNNDLDDARNDSDPDFDISEIVISGSGSAVNRKRKKNNMMAYCPVCEIEICTSNGHTDLIEHIKSHTEEESEAKQVCQKCCRKRGDMDTFTEHKKKCHTSRGFKNQQERCSFCVC